MEVNFVNQKTCIPSWLVVFQFHIFFLLSVLSKSMCIYAFGPSASPSSSLVILFIYSAFFVIFFGCHIFFKIIRFLLHPVVGMFSYHLLPIVDRIFFHCFRMSCFFLYCFILCRYLFNLPSFARTFWFLSSSCIVIFSSDAFSFLFLHIPASFLCFIILACFLIFFYLRFQSKFSSWIWFFFRAFWGNPNFQINKIKFSISTFESIIS